MWSLRVHFVRSNSISEAGDWKKSPTWILSHHQSLLTNNNTTLLHTSCRVPGFTFSPPSLSLSLSLSPPPCLYAVSVCLTASTASCCQTSVCYCWHHARQTHTDTHTFCLTQFAFSPWTREERLFWQQKKEHPNSRTERRNVIHVAQIPTHIFTCVDFRT